MDRERAKRLLLLLDSHTFRPASQLSLGLGLSERTVRTLVRETNAELEAYGATIESRTRHGYRLVVTDEQLYAQFLATPENPHAVPVTAAERADYLAINLLFQRDYVKRDDLCSQLYVSHSTLSAAIKEAEIIFSSYGLTIDRKPNHGIRVKGAEREMRRLIVDYLENPQAIAMGAGFDARGDVAHTANRVRELFVSHGFPASEEAFNYFVNIACVSVWRAVCGFDVGEPSDTLPAFLPSEHAVVRELLEPYLQMMGEGIVAHEETWLLVHLACNRVDLVAPSQRSSVVQSSIDLLAEQILEKLSRDFHVDLARRFDLRMALSRHLTTLDTRMRFGIPSKNPLLAEVRRDYPLAYAMALEAGVVLEQHYKVPLGEDELGYLALIFELSLERDLADAKRNVLVVTGEGPAATGLLQHRVRQRFGDIVGEVGVCSVFSLGAQDLNNIDYILSTVPVELAYDIPVVEISSLLSEADEARAREMMTRGDSERVAQEYIGEQRFLARSGLRTKDEVLARLCAYVSAHERVDRGFYSLVAERSRSMTARLGSGATIAHPGTRASERTFAYLLVLEEPVEWDGEPVSVVALSSTGKQDRTGAKRMALYDLLASFCLDGGAIKELVSSPTYETFLRLLCNL